MELYLKIHNLVVRLLSCLIIYKKARKFFRETFTIELDPYNQNRKLYNIGVHSYLGKNTVILNKEETSIGNFSCIACNCRIGLHQHPTNF